MYRTFVSDTPQIWAQFFDRTPQSGGGGDFFSGDLYQRGNGIFSGILRGLVRHVLPAAKSLGKSAVKQAANTGLSVASDVLSGHDAGESFERHGRQAARQILGKAGRVISANSKKRGGNSKKSKKRTKQSVKGGGQVGGKKKGRKKQTGRGIGVFKAVTASGIKARLKQGKKTRYRDALGAYVL